MRNTALAVMALVVAAAPVRAASFDCAKASHAVEKAICADAGLSEKDSRMAALYRERLGLLSPEGQDILRQSQRQWNAVMRRVCVKGEGGCVSNWLDSRLKALGNAGLTQGPFRFLSVDFYEARKVSDEDPHRKYTPYATSERSFAQIDGDAPGVARWNTLMRETYGQQKPEEDTDDYLMFSVSHASARVISLRIDSYIYPHGAAHGMGGAFGDTFLLDRGRRIEPADLFAVGTPWQPMLEDAVMADLWRQAKEEDFPLFPEAATSVHEATTDPGYWLLTPQGLTLIFPPYAVAAYAFGIREVAVPWTSLKPYLTADAPIR